MIEAGIEQLVPQPTAAVRVIQPMAFLDLAALFDLHLPGVARRLGALGVEPAGAPYGRYHEFGPEQVDVEIGIPVPGPLRAWRRWTRRRRASSGSSELPGGPAAVTVHRGGYDGLPAPTSSCWPGSGLPAARRAEGHGSRTSTTRPRSAEEDVRTEIVWPLG